MNRAEHILATLGEEGGEVSKEVMKALRFGIHDKVTRDPNGPRGTEGPTNGEKIAAEMTDMLAMYRMAVMEGLVPDLGIAILGREDVTAAMDRKQARVEAYMAYARRVGALNAIPDLGTMACFQHGTQGQFPFRMLVEGPKGFRYLSDGPTAEALIGKWLDSASQSFPPPFTELTLPSEPTPVYLTHPDYKEDEPPMVTMFPGERDEFDHVRIQWADGNKDWASLEDLRPVFAPRTVLDPSQQGADHPSPDGPPYGTPSTDVPPFKATQDDLIFVLFDKVASFRLWKDKHAKGIPNSRFRASRNIESIIGFRNVTLHCVGSPGYFGDLAHLSMARGLNLRVYDGAGDFLAEIPAEAPKITPEVADLSDPRSKDTFMIDEGVELDPWSPNDDDIAVTAAGSPAVWRRRTDDSFEVWELFASATPNAATPIIAQVKGGFFSWSFLVTWNGYKEEGGLTMKDAPDARHLVLKILARESCTEPPKWIDGRTPKERREDAGNFDLEGNEYPPIPAVIKGEPGIWHFRLDAWKRHTWELVVGGYEGPPFIERPCLGRVQRNERTGHWCLETFDDVIPMTGHEPTASEARAGVERALNA